MNGKSQNLEINNENFIKMKVQGHLLISKGNFFIKVKCKISHCNEKSGNKKNKKREI